MKQKEKKSLAGKKITRKEAIKKAGISTLATSSFLLLKTNAHASASNSNNEPGTNTDDDFLKNIYEGGN